VNAGLILVQLLNGITLGAIYVLVAVGLTIVFGMLNIINFAHGSLYALGAYFAFMVATVIGESSGSFWAAAVVAPVLTGIFGAIIEITLLRRMYHELHEYQILLTFGVAMVLQEIIILIWGTYGKSIPMPSQLDGVIHLGLFTFPTYRIFLILFTAVTCFALWLMIEKTKYGSIIRAGTENRNMVSCLGIDINKVFTVIFALGVGMAGLAGALSLPMRGAQSAMGDSIMLLCFVTITIGGLGSFTGAILGGLIVGIVESMMALVWPQGGMISIFAAMALVILVKPTGLMGLK
jgi:branched-chain amino acid transport system permease protein